MTQANGGGGLPVEDGSPAGADAEDVTIPVFGGIGSGKSLMLSYILAASRQTALHSVGSLRRDLAALDAARRKLAAPTPGVVTRWAKALSAARREEAEDVVQAVFSQIWPTFHPIGSTVQRELFLDLRGSLLRLVDGIRAVLRLTLIRVLSALSWHQDMPSFVLVLLASCRCYGHRGEPDDHALPALTSMSAVIGEAARGM